MTVMDYCLSVQTHVKTCKPPQGDPAMCEWFGDSGRASIAVSAAINGERADALNIAEPLAEKYNLP